MNSQHTNDTVQSLSGFERVSRVVSITLIIVFALEISLFVAGYVGMVHMKIETALWFLWSFFYALFMLVTPILFIITISGAGYLFFRVLKQKGNRHVAITAAIAAGMNLLALLGMNTIGRVFYRHVKNVYGDIVTEQRDWEGETLPNFTFQGIQEGVPPIAIEDLQSKRSVLVFWATYDTPWSSNFNIAQELYEQREKLNINLLAIAVDGSKKDVGKFLERHPSNMPVYHDPNANYERSLHVMGSVELVFIVDSTTRIQIVLETSPDVLDKIKATLDRIQ